MGIRVASDQSNVEVMDSRLQLKEAQKTQWGQAHLGRIEIQSLLNHLLIQLHFKHTVIRGDGPLHFKSVFATF